MRPIRDLFVALSLIWSAFALAGPPVDINSADAEALADAIQGVGVKKAEAIVAYREANGPFRSVEELADVSGIGLKLIERNRDNLTIAPSGE